MENEKLEPLLNLSLSSTLEERERSPVLSTGFQPASRTWELIVKYHGDLSRLADETIQVEQLIAGYAIVTIPEPLIPSLAALEEIEYVEQPKRLFFEVLQGIQASCILPVTLREPFLTGRGVLTAFIDSGIDYTNPDFRNPDGTTRIRYLWDQSLTPDEDHGWYSPQGFTDGVEFSSEMLNAALAQATPEQALSLIPSRDITGHGTAVAGIGAGNGALSDGRYAGVAPQSELLVVKLGNPRPASFPRTTELMRALTYAVQKSLALSMPIAVNLSFGNTYGPHDGGSLLERFLDNLSEIGRTSICVGSGNEGASAGHASGRIQDRKRIEWSVADYQQTLSLQLWKDYADEFRITLLSPDGSRRQIDTGDTGPLSLLMQDTQVLLYVGDPSPYTVNQEIFFDFLPQGRYVSPGVWALELEEIRTVSGQYTLYLSSSAVRSAGTGFFAPTPEITLTIPSTARKVITVAAYDSTYEAYADFSGRGYLFTDRLAGSLEINTIKPDLAAPGVGIMAPTTSGGYLPVTGTSFAAPFVTGSAALLMEWGIVRGNDPFLYGEKIKAFLRRGARPLRGQALYPNEKTGYGALCVRDSLPI